MKYTSGEVSVDIIHAVWKRSKDKVEELLLRLKWAGEEGDGSLFNLNLHDMVRQDHHYVTSKRVTPPYRASYPTFITACITPHAYTLLSFPTF
jgi:hypothetical protein